MNEAYIPDKVNAINSKMLFYQSCKNFFFFLRQSFAPYVTQASLKFMTLLPQPPKCQDYELS
jgi:hypothetical protein